jgi:hypothetical protein
MRRVMFCQKRPDMCQKSPNICQGAGMRKYGFGIRRGRNSGGRVWTRVYIHVVVVEYFTAYMGTRVDTCNVG